MPQNNQAGMIRIREEARKDMWEYFYSSSWCSLSVCTFTHPRVPAGTALSTEAIRLVFLATSVIFVHKGQSLKPKALLWYLHLDRELKLPLPGFSQNKAETRSQELEEKSSLCMSNSAEIKLLHPYRQDSPALEKDFLLKSMVWDTEPGRTQTKATALRRKWSN